MCLISLLFLSNVVTATGTAEVIVAVGGEDDKVVLRSVESFDPVTSQWKNLACLPFAVSKHGLVVSGEESLESKIKTVSKLCENKK